MENRKARAGGKAAVSNKILYIFALCFVAVFFVILLERYMMRGDTFLAAYAALTRFGGICIAAFVAGALIMIVRGGPFSAAERKILSGRSLMLAAAYLGLPTLLIFLVDFTAAIKFLYVLFPALAVIWLFFLMYQRAFFANVLLCCFAAVAMWLMSGTLAAGDSGGKLAILVTALAVFAIAAGAFFWMKKKGGRVKVRGNELYLMERDANYLLLWGTCLLHTVFFIAAFFTNATVAYYLVFAAMGYLLLLLIYYTAKLI